MHDVELPKFIIDKIEAKRGDLGLFDTLDMAKTALVVIDMQNGFVAEGAPLEVPKARGIVPNINRLAAATRAAGGEVIWVAMTMDEDDGDNYFPIYYRYFFQEAGRERHRAALTEGSELHALYSELDVHPDEAVILKNRFSALVQGASGLDAHCKARGIDTLIVVGTLTNVCCESTARDAMMIDYRVMMPADASATTSDEEHVASLISVAQFFADIRPTDEVVALIESSGAGRQAAE